MSKYIKNQKICAESLKKMHLVLSKLSHEDKRACYKILRDTLYDKEETRKRSATEKTHKEVVDYINTLKQEAIDGKLKKFVSASFYYEMAAEVFGIESETAANIYRKSLKN